MPVPVLSVQGTLHFFRSACDQHAITGNTRRNHQSDLLAHIQTLRTPSAYSSETVRVSCRVPLVDIYAEQYVVDGYKSTSGWMASPLRKDAHWQFKNDRGNPWADHRPTLSRLMRASPTIRTAKSSLGLVGHEEVIRLLRHQVRNCAVVVLEKEFRHQAPSEMPPAETPFRQGKRDPSKASSSAIALFA